jgi:hypothetical protein
MLVREHEKIETAREGGGGSGAPGVGSGATSAGSAAGSSTSGSGGSREAGSQTSGSASGGAVGGGHGQGTRQAPPPMGVPEGQDDDIVARQLREAAENETDPGLKEKLWEEYYAYKNAGIGSGAARSYDKSSSGGSR